MNKIKTILIGTSEFAVEVFKSACLELKNRLEIIAVITAPDKPVGRKRAVLPSPVKRWAIGANLSVLEPIKIKDMGWISKIKKLNPELIILCAYGQIIPKEILNIPKYGALNIHPSLLPKYRGASPIHAAILKGDKETGVTISLMDELLDHGPIIQNSKFKIQNSKISYKKLSDKLADVGADLLIKTLPDYIAGKIKPQEQNHSQATFCKLIKKEDGKIDWDKSAQEIEGMIRAYAVWPTAYTKVPNPKSQIPNNLKILNAEIQNKNANKKIGEIFLTDDKQLAVQTGNGILVIKQLQLEGKKPMTAKDFLNGYPGIVGSNLQ